MARKRTNEDRKLAIDSLFRVRAVETPADTSGEKEVWHQGSKGADLFTVVNRTGHVVRQEFVLFDDYYSWNKAGGLRTGTTSETRGIKDVVKATDEIKMDPFVNDERVDRAQAALSSYTGSDRYLEHLRVIINTAAAGGEAGELSAVTSAQELNKDLKARYYANKAKKEKQPLWPFLAAGAGAGVVVVLIVWMLIR